MAKGISSINKAADELSFGIWGMTRARAVNEHVCINCREDIYPKITTSIGFEKYKCTGLCESCYNDIM